MGTWGSGNFENDTAADHVGIVCGPLLKQIQHTMRHKKLMEPDEYDSVAALANLEILTRLADLYGFPALASDKGRSEMAQWKTKYLKVWDRCIDALEPSPDHKRERRQVIVDTFDRFEQAVRKATE